MLQKGGDTDQMASTDVGTVLCRRRSSPQGLGASCRAQELPAGARSSPQGLGAPRRGLGASLRKARLGSVRKSRLFLMSSLLPCYIMLRYHVAMLCYHVTTQLLPCYHVTIWLLPCYHMAATMLPTGYHVTNSVLPCSCYHATMLPTLCCHVLVTMLPCYHVLPCYQECVQEVSV